MCQRFHFCAYPSEFRTVGKATQGANNDPNRSFHFKQQCNIYIFKI